MMRSLEAWTPRRFALVGLGFCVLMMGVALFLEHVMGLEPCPLCIFQRVAVMATALVLALAALHGPRGWGGIVYGVLGLLTVAAGIGLAGRHLWLQSLPPSEVPSCGPGLDYMLEILPLQKVLSMVLVGSGECAEVGGRLLGLSLPGWTLIGFVVLALSPLGMLRAALNGRRRQVSA
ncbi:MAG: disulfide bond formation protein B [Halomonadaceae bacterium]|jgi:disulfide bond formation protein DsbB|nr:disulfide bond formation protein B [Halomonadaceae bacterium]